MKSVNGDISFNVWIDGQHVSRKVVVVESVQGENVTTTMNVTSVNQPVHVTPPPASPDHQAPRQFPQRHVIVLRARGRPPGPNSSAQPSADAMDGTSPRSARPRWLIASFASGAICAVVSPSACATPPWTSSAALGTKIGS